MFVFFSSFNDQRPKGIPKEPRDSCGRNWRHGHWRRLRDDRPKFPSRNTEGHLHLGSHNGPVCYRSDHWGDPAGPWVGQSQLCGKLKLKAYKNKFGPRGEQKWTPRSVCNNCKEAVRIETQSPFIDYCILDDNSMLTQEWSWLNVSNSGPIAEKTQIYYFLLKKKGTLNLADIEGWNVAENEGLKVADTFFLRAVKLPIKNRLRVTSLPELRLKLLLRRRPHGLKNGQPIFCLKIASLL